MALDGLLKRKLVSRRKEVGPFVGQAGASKPGPWILPEKARTTRMPQELDIAFPPSGCCLTFSDVPLNAQPPDLLMQFTESFFVRDSVMKLDDGAIRKPAEVLLGRLLDRLSEIRKRRGGADAGG